MSGLVVFDLCDTLVAENTTSGFLALMADRHPGIDRAVRRWTRRSSPGFWMGAIAYRLGRDLARERLIASLAGVSRKEIERGAAAYAVQVTVNEVILDRLESHRENNDRIMIVSSSLDPVVRAIASRLRVEGRGTTLTFDDDLCTGRIETDLTGRKLSVVDATELPLVAAYSDNRTDLGLLAAAAHGVLVIPFAGVQPRSRPRGVDEVLDA